MDTLFSWHPVVLETAYSELKRQAAEQTLLLSGTPGSVSVREVNGRPFLYRQFYDPQGKKQAEYLGSSDDPVARNRADAQREAIATTTALLVQARLLARQGYARADTGATAVLTALARRDLFRAGALLVGSHAYGCLLNELGVRAAAFRTGDVDVARRGPLAIRGSFEEMLSESLLPLTPVPGFDRKTPPSSHKAPGREGLRVDLLAPTGGSEVRVVAVPELSSHATGLPHLGYLLEDSRDAIVLGREAVVPVRVPSPERFAWHKMLVSQLRTATSEKRSKDLLQAAVLFAALAERESDVLGPAFEAIGQKRKTRAGAAAVLALLEASSHTRGASALREIL